MKSKSPKLRIALAEDNPLLSRAIRQKLAIFRDDFEVVFHAADGGVLLERLQEHAGVDVILMDIEMPRVNGIAATAEVCRRFPHIRVVMFTVFDDEQRILQAIQAGAMGYLLKDEPAATLRESILDIAAGGAPMSRSIATRALQLLRDPSRADLPAATTSEPLTPRETEVLVQLAEGLEYREIATNLFIAPATVRKHIENIYRKLQVGNKMQAVRRATRDRLI